MAAKWRLHAVDPRSVLVVVFDMCSSTSIVEDLTRRGEIRRLESLMRAMKRHLMNQTKHLEFVAYKFMGDGWILLFNPEVNSGLLLRFLRELCATYQRAYEAEIEPYLSRPLEIVGLTFGLARGPLVEMRMFKQPEFIGRALNVASRLQGGVKDSKGQHTPAYRALATLPVFDDYFARQEVRHKRVKRELRNMNGGRNFPCVKLFLRDVVTTRRQPKSGKAVEFSPQ